MSGNTGASTEAFAERIFRLLERVTYSVAHSHRDLVEIGRLRYEAYLREAFIKAETYPDGVFLDSYDYQGKVKNIRITIDGMLVSCIRIHYLASLDDPGPTRMAFADLMDPYLAAGCSIIDPGRLAVSHQAAQQYSYLPLVTLRLLHMAQRYYDADFCMPAMQAGHQAFYKRYLLYEVLSLPRAYPQVTRPVGLMIGRKDKLDAVVSQYPFFDSTVAERAILFGV